MRTNYLRLHCKQIYEYKNIHAQLIYEAANIVKWFDMNFQFTGETVHIFFHRLKNWFFPLWAKSCFHMQNIYTSTTHTQTHRDMCLYKILVRCISEAIKLNYWLMYRVWGSSSSQHVILHNNTGFTIYFCLSTSQQRPPKKKYLRKKTQYQKTSSFAGDYKQKWDNFFVPNYNTCTLTADVIFRRIFNHSQNVCLWKTGDKIQISASQSVDLVRSKSQYICVAEYNILIESHVEIFHIAKNAIKKIADVWFRIEIVGYIIELHQFSVEKNIGHFFNANIPHKSVISFCEHFFFFSNIMIEKRLYVWSQKYILFSFEQVIRTCKLKQMKFIICYNLKISACK